MIEEHYSVDIHRPKQNSPERLGLNCFAIKKHMEEIRLILLRFEGLCEILGRSRCSFCFNFGLESDRKLKLSLLAVGCQGRGH
jgi:hypothetical protein